MQITINNIEHTIPDNSSYFDLSEQLQADYSSDICLVYENNTLRPLTAEIKPGVNVRFITTADNLGMECYRRSLVFLCIRAFNKVLGEENKSGIRVLFSVDKGYYLEAGKNVVITRDLLSQVENAMREYVKDDEPIIKSAVSTANVVKLFDEEGMYDKSRLFGYRRASVTNVYELDGYFDYFYGYMLPSCGKLKYFALIPYMDGFILRFPSKSNPKELGEFIDTPNVNKTLLASTHWSQKLGACTVADLNDMIVKDSIGDLILIQEATQNQKLSDIASEIKNRGTVKFVMIAGPSSSGKTTFSHRLSVQLRAHGLNPHPIAVDNYFLNRVDTPKDENGDYNYEDLDSIDVKLFNDNMSRLLAGERVELPVYNFVKGEKEYKGNFLQLGENDILVIEGIHCLNSKLYPQLPQDRMYKIYISALTQLNVDEHNRVSTTDGRLIRRMVRDARTRGNSAKDTIARWASVRKGEEKNIFPYQESADVVFNSAQIYELSVLKPYAEKVLFSVEKSAPEYTEAKRLLKFLDYFLTLPAEGIPTDSILREFVGGGIFKL